MERLRRGWFFWVLLLVSFAVPASASKAVYQGQIKIGTRVYGSSVVQPKIAGYEVLTSTWMYPNQVVTRVYISINGDPAGRQLVLCENGSAAYADCTYSANGNLDLESVITPTSLYLAGITGEELQNALDGGTAQVTLNTGATGTYTRIL